jgi:lipoate-protein ligase A
MLEILDTGIHCADFNMRFDEKLLDQLKKPTLHLYSWAKPSATYGYFIRPEKHLDLQKATQRHLDLARRPTGGGIVFHIWDLAFSFLLPSTHPSFSLSTLENYRFVNNIVLDVIRQFFSLDGPSLIAQDVPSNPDCKNFCMAKPTQYDVVYKGLKIAGAAQRKRKQGYLHQGTISLAYPHVDLLSNLLLNKKAILEAMKSYTFAPLGRLWTPQLLQRTRQDLQKLLADKFQRALKF